MPNPAMPNTDKRQPPTGGPHVPSGPRGDTPATAGKDKTQLRSHTPENRNHRINPSAPNDGMTPPADRAAEEK
jgi:hypothetical protein